MQRKLNTNKVSTLQIGTSSTLSANSTQIFRKHMLVITIYGLHHFIREFRPYKRGAVLIQHFVVSLESTAQWQMWKVQHEKSWQVHYSVQSMELFVSISQSALPKLKDITLHYIFFLQYVSQIKKQINKYTNSNCKRAGCHCDQF